MLKENKNIKKGYILMLITVIIWGMDNVLVKSLLNNEIPTVLLIYLRFIFATITVGIILKIKKEKYDKETINPKYKKLIMGMAITLSIYYILQVNGLSMTKAVISEFIGTTMTTISTIVILAIFIKCERKQIMNKYTMLALIIAISGTFLTTLGDLSFGLDFGAILIIIADIFWGLYTMIYIKINEKVSAIKVNRDLGIVALISIIIDVGTIMTYYVAVRIISGVKCSILSLVSPIISFILSYFYLGERIVFMQFCGCILLFASSILLVIKDYINNKKDEIIE